MATPTIKPHQVAESFVGVPGIIIEMIRSTVSPTAIAVDGSWTDIMTGTFEVPVAGTYKVTWNGAVYTNGGSGTYRADFRLNFDSGDQLISNSTTKITMYTGEERVPYFHQLEVDLTAGTHTVAAQWIATSGTGILQCNTDDFVVLIGQLVSGSGAGGVLAERASAPSHLIDTDYVSPWSPLEITELTQTVDVVEGEQVLALFGGYGQQTGGGSTTMYVWLYLDDAGTEGAYEFMTRNSGWADWERGDLSFSYLTAPLTAGSHIFRIYVAKTGSGEANWTLPSSYLHLVQYRGGLVPVQRDGTIVHSTPRALNFTGASLQVSESNDVVDIGLSDAVTAPGDLIILSDGVPSATLLINSGGDHQIMPETGSLSFEAKVNGTYMILFSGELIAGSSNSSVQLKLVFDEGETYEQTVGYNESWQTRPTTGNYTEPVFKDQVTLTAGTHTVKAYGTLIEGTSAQVTLANDHPFVLSLQAVVGSGAGGSLLSQAVLASDFVTPSEDNWHAVDGLSNTFDTAAGETVQLCYSLMVSHGALSTFGMAYRVDSGSWTVIETRGGQYDDTFSGSLPISNLSAGSHTVEIGVYTDYSTLTVWSTSTQWYSTDRTSYAAITRYRGGLVPIRNSGVQVVDKPAALNFQGALEVQNASGVANIRMPDAITAPGQIRTLTEGQPASAINIDGTETQIYPETGADSFTALTAGLHRVDLNLPLAGNGADYNTYQFRVVFDEGLSSEVSIGYTEEWRCRNSDAQWAYPSFFGNIELEAKSYTVKVFGQRIAGTGSAFIPDTSVSNLAVTVLVTAVTGSGAGGILLGQQQLSGSTTLAYDATRPPTALVPGISLTINTTPGEEIQLVASGAAQNNGGSLNTMDFRFAVDGTPIRSYSTYSNTVPNSYASDVHLTEFFTATAAQHTITLLGGRNNATSMILWDQFTVSAYQVRGGLVPITDGFTTVDKPTSQKFVNASVTDDAGQAVVTLPEAVVAPGSTQTIFDQIPGGTYQITNTSAFEDFDASFEQEFTVQTAGTYLLTWAATIFGASSSGGGYLRLLFDEGGFNGHTEQTVGDATKPWGIQASNNFHEARSFSASVTLAAGTHKVKPQCQKETVYGTANPSIDGNSSWFIQATLVSGSGAQGNLLAEAATTVNNTVTALSPSVLPTEPLLVSFDSADENVTLHFNGLIANTVGSGATTVVIEPWMDGSAVGAHQLIIPTAGWYESSSFSIPVAVTAGSHTVEIYAYTGTSQQWRLQAGAKFWVMQDRGGLVPIKNDGVLIQDTPHSINLLGPGLQGTNVNGAVHVSVNSAAEGVDTESYTIPWPTTVNTASPSYQNIHEFTFDVTEGERLLCTFSGRGNPAASGVGMYVRFYSVELGTNWGFTNVYAETDNLRNVGTSGMSPPLPAGTATIRLEASTAGVGGNWDMEGGYFTVSRFRGGFVVPENVPELAYNSASVIDVQPKAGTSSRLWLLLNDGVRYHADGTQTIDLTTSGLGGLDTGSEAVSTWYYCYAVPSDTAGVFDVVASETDPDSGGPTGYAAWRYLGAVYNDSAGDLRKWYQTGATFEYATHYDAYDSGGTGTTDASPVLTDLTDYVPKTSASAILQLYRQGQNVAGSFQVWVDGEQGDVSTGWHISVANPDTAYSGQANMGLVPTPGTTKQIYRRNTANYNYSYIKCMGWVDRWLDSNNSQAQTSYDPDTPPPRGTWIDTTEVDFAAWPGHPSTLRLALSDGKTRIASGTLAVDKNNGVADLGYDDASSQGNSKWLYFYAVPKTGDDDAFTIVMSDNPPTTGPLGRSASKYLWSTYIDGSGDLREVFQVDVERFITNDTKPAASCTTLATWIGSWTDYAIDDVVPLTASAVEIRAHIRHTASGTSQQALLVGPEGGGWLYPAYCLGANDFNQVCGLVPLPGTATKKVALQNYTWDATTDQVAHQEIRFSGWVDGYLAADAGIGAVVGGGGTASPLTTKGDLYTYDTDNARLGVGSNGQVLTADSAEATGIKWASISHPTQAYLREEAFSTTGAETPGATVSHVIAATPRAAGTTSGYDVVVFRNGLKMKNVASLTGAYDEFTFTVGTLTVAVTASGSADDYDVDFRS